VPLSCAFCTACNKNSRRAFTPNGCGIHQSFIFLPAFANGLRRHVPDTVWLLEEHPKSVALTLRIATPLLPYPNTKESWAKDTPRRKKMPINQLFQLIQLQYFKEENHNQLNMLDLLQNANDFITIINFYECGFFLIGACLGIFEEKICASPKYLSH